MQYIIHNNSLNDIFTGSYSSLNSAYLQHGEVNIELVNLYERVYYCTVVIVE